MMKKTLIIIIHAILVILAYSSPVWLDWKLFVAGLLIYGLQILIFKGCILTIAQFKGSEPGFVAYYLDLFFKKLGLEIKISKLQFFVRRVVPFLLLASALVFQLAINIKPIISL